MISVHSLLAALAASGVLLSVDANAAGAVTTTSSSAKPEAATRFDPNEEVCKTQDVTGSRLGAKKVCHTREQWADIAAQSRVTVDRAQQQTVSPGH